MRLHILGLLTTLAIAQPARAQEGGGGGGGGGGARGIGVLSEALISGLGTGVLAGAIYDAGRFRFGGSLGLLAQENAATAFALGLQGYFVLHEAKNADFGIGGGFQLAYNDPGPGDAKVRFGITAGGQARLFVVENAAITAGIGLNISLGKGGFEFLLGSALTGTFGLQYYF